MHVLDVGDIVIAKRRGQRSIRVTVNGSIVKVTQPTWLPFSAGEKFIEQRLSWIKEHHKPVEVYVSGQYISRDRQLSFARSSRLTIGSRVSENDFCVLLPAHKYPEDADVQTYIQKKLISILRSDAEDYLPGRVLELARMFGFGYKSVQVKLLKRRWGSCNSKKELVFNLKLMSLDQLHIDYVILHELTHTVHMKHGDKFWTHMESVMPGAKKIAKTVRYADTN